MISGSARSTRSIKAVLVFLIVFLIVVALPSYSSASETVLNINLNQMAKGDFFVIMTNDGDFLVLRDDLENMGLSVIEGAFTEMEGQTYVFLSSLHGVEYELDDATLTLNITASPDLFPKKKIDLIARRPLDVYYPTDSSAFLNYALEYSENDMPNSYGVRLTNELGARYGEYLFLTDSTYTKTSNDSDFVRLQSSMIYERREDLIRMTGGDFFASSGDLGSSVNMGGFSYSKNYVMDPYFRKYPLPSFFGSATVPSKVEVYVDDVRVMSDDLSPGNFELANIMSYSGSHDLEILIRDAFGRETRMRNPFYLTRELLKRGLQEYSYNAGFLRRKFGTRSMSYSTLAVSAFHNFGLTDAITLGYRAEAGGDAYNAGPEVSFLLPRAGTVTASLSASRDTGGDRWGLATLLRYRYISRSISASMDVNTFSRDYVTLAEQSGVTTRYRIGSGISYNLGGHGTVSVDASLIDRVTVADSRSFNVAYSRPISLNTTLFARFRTFDQEKSNYEFFLGFTYRFGKSSTLSANIRGNDDENFQFVQLNKSAPLGQGIGYLLSAGRSEEEVETAYSVNSAVQYNAKYGIYRADYRGKYTDEHDRYEYHIAASGGIAYVGGTIGISRPIQDSFGLVRVADIEGARVYANNQLIGKTDSSGKVFVPELISYTTSQIAVNDKDVPLEYKIPKVYKNISPSLRSGSVIDFEVERFQAITGMLKMQVAGEAMPVEFRDVQVNIEGKETTTFTGRGGELYMENVAPGQYPAFFTFEGKDCGFTLEIPESKEMIVDLGDVVCNADEK